jgi:putative ABC transport system substrate-binding protein
MRIWKPWIRALLLAAAICAASAAFAQQPAKNPRVGFLHSGLGEAVALRINAFVQGVREATHLERGQIELISRIAEGDPARLPAFAREIAAAKVDVFFAAGPAATRAALAAAPTVPLVSLDLETDPIEGGLISSLARPGANLTGIFFDFPDFGTKWLELLREVVPKLSRLAVLWDPGTGQVQLKAVETIAGSMGIRLQVIEVKNFGSIEEAFRSARDGNPEALLLLSSPIFGSKPATLAELALRDRLPAITLFPEFAQTGGLLAYGPNVIDLFRQAGTMTGKLLAGARPADLPVERPVRFQLVVNLKTAKALGLTIPPALLIRADEVIE